MRRTVFLKSLVLSLIIASALVSCSGKDDESEQTASIETTAEFDNSNFGLYKGVIVGSSGTVKIEINNGNNVAKATITIDSQTDVLTCTSTLTNGQAIVNITFKGNISTFTFSVDANGKNPVIAEITIDGHDNVSAAIAKETSTNVASCYEGTFTGGNDAKGAFNAVRNNNTFSVAVKDNNGISYSSKGNVNTDGTFSGSAKTVFGVLSVTLNFSGKFSGDDISGTWNTSWTGGTNSGSFSGKKTL